VPLFSRYFWHFSIGDYSIQCCSLESPMSSIPTWFYWTLNLISKISYF
jgi:hypothetical protein